MTTDHKTNAAVLFDERTVDAVLVARYGYAQGWPGRRAAIRSDLATAIAALDRDALVALAARGIRRGAADDGTEADHATWMDAERALTAIGLIKEEPA